MNKEGSSKIPGILFALFIFYVVCSVGILVYLDGEGKACRDLGFEDDSYWNGRIACEDKESNIHFVKMDCKDSVPFPWKYNCKAKLIKVGEVFGDKK